MKKWSATDFMKDFGFEEEFEEKYEEKKFKPKSKLEKYKEGEFVKEDVTPVFEITYMEESGFGVYSCVDKYGQEFSIKGCFPKHLKLNKEYKMEGKVETYKGDKQLVVEKIETSLPTSKAGIIKYLKTLKGLKNRANAIYDVYGNRSLEALRENPMEVANLITGVGKKNVLSWQRQLMELEDSEAELIYLINIGLKPHQAKKLYDKYEDKIIEKIEENPYMLARELERFGFVKADEIARGLGYEMDSPHRIQEGVIYALDTAIYEGHCFLPEAELFKKATELLNVFPKSNPEINSTEVKLFRVKPDDIKHAVKLLSLEGRVMLVQDKVYLEQLYHAETEVAQHVARIQDYEKQIQWDVSNKLEEYCKIKKIKLEEEQQKAVVRFASSTGGIHILNGSAGTGKTFTLRIIIDMLKAMYKEMGERPQTLLLAPTGKASKVATKATGMECKTIHRGLKYNPKVGFEHNSSNPFDADIIIVDETSMLDILLAKHLFSAVKFGAKVILLGDTKQLPSVGPGNVLRDLTASNKVDTITLTVPKRQEAQSGIIANANNIIEGKMIEKQATHDAFFINVSSVAQARNELLSLFSRIQTYKNFEFNDIQLLCPQRIGPIGADYMNYLIQKNFNKSSSSKKILNKTILGESGERFELFFKEGDRVIHIKNNYDMLWYKKDRFFYTLMGEEFSGITNGECGVIEEIRDTQDQYGNVTTKVYVKYDDMYIIYENGVEEIDHAYALTVHKFQGSASPAVIAPIMMANYIMLDNNLFYTLYTRSESFITIVGEVKAVEHAIRTQRSKHRYTTLQEFIR